MSAKRQDNFVIFPNLDLAGYGPNLPPQVLGQYFKVYTMFQGVALAPRRASIRANTT